jgi:elongation factor P
MIVTSQLHSGSIFKMGNDVVIVQKMLGNKTGRGAMISKIRVKNIITGQTMDLALDMNEKFEDIELDLHVMKLSYIDDQTYVFMEQETFEQFELSKEDLGDNAGYLSPDDDTEVEITFYEGKPVGVQLPIAIERTIQYCEPGIKGDTSGKSMKPATLDTGITVNVPLFCDIGTKIKVDTRDGSFIERVK